MSVQQSETIKLDLPASHKHLNILSTCIEALMVHVEGIADRELVIYNAQLAAHEACTNIVDHAYPDQPEGRIAITLTLDYQQRQLIVDLRDTGQGFDLSSMPMPDLNQAQEHGYGLFLIHNLMDEVTYTSAPGDNHWRLVKYL